MGLFDVFQRGCNARATTSTTPLRRICRVRLPQGRDTCPPADIEPIHNVQNNAHCWPVILSSHCPAHGRSGQKIDKGSRTAGSCTAWIGPRTAAVA